ncbi:MAG: MCE family protein, partial [Cyanobacteria bacterium REEB65]|nr:MCE family protein [Cyanobacteria bacterium REEB65]
MGVNSATKVGVLTVASAVLAGAVFAWMVRFNPRSHGYDLQLVYHDVSGLAPGARVMLMGVSVGRVLSVVPGTSSVRVTAEIDHASTRIYQDSHFRIYSQGLVGQKALEIFPPAEPTGSFVVPGDVIAGEDPVRLEASFEAADKAVKTLERFADSPETRQTFEEGLKSLKATFAKIDTLSDNLDDLVLQADRFVGHGSALAEQIHGSDVREMVADLKFLSHGLRQSYQALLGSPDRRSAAQEAINNLAKLSERLDHVAGQIDSFTSDPKLKSNLADIVSQSKDLLASLHGPANRTTPAFSPRLEILGLTQNDAEQNPPQLNTLTANLGLRLGVGDTAFMAGAEEVGQNTLFDLTWGMPDFFAQGTGFHLGLIRSKMGLGVDFTPFAGTELAAELYDPVRTQFRLSALVFPDFLAHRYGLDVEW